MSANMQAFRRGAISPVECLREGWAMIKEQYWLFFGIVLVGVLVASAVPMGIILGPMMCGIYICIFQRRRGLPVRFDMLFKGFDYFAQSIIATLIQIAPIMALMIPFYLIFFVSIVSSAAQGGGRNGEPPVMLFVLMAALFTGMMLVIFLVAAFFIFTFPLIVDRKLGGVDAVKTSVRAVMGNLGGVLGLLFLNALLAMAGVLLCYVGAFLFAPVGMAAWAVAYERVFGLSAEPAA